MHTLRLGVVCMDSMAAVVLSAGDGATCKRTPQRQESRAEQLCQQHLFENVGSDPVSLGISVPGRTTNNGPNVRSAVRINAQANRGARLSSRAPAAAQTEGGAADGQGGCQRWRLLRIP